MPLPLLGALGISAGANILGNVLGGIFGSNEKDKQADRIDREFSERQKRLARGYKELRAAQMGQTAISPEAQLAYDTSSKSAANAIDATSRSATSSNEALASVAGITNNQNKTVRAISAAEGARRRIAAENAAKAGLAGEQAAVDLDFQKDATKRGAFNDVNQVVGGWQNLISGIGGDVVSASLMSKLFPSTGG